MLPSNTPTDHHQSAFFINALSVLRLIRETVIGAFNFILFDGKAAFLQLQRVPVTMTNTPPHKKQLKLIRYHNTPLSVSFQALSR